MIMPANNESRIVYYYAGKYPGKVGLLFTPRSWRPPLPFMPYALDNGCFTKWESEMFLKMLKKARYYHKPLWIVVPDVVGDSEATIKQWYEWAPKVKEYGFPLAFACQDGMEPQDVPKGAFCCFIGGTTNWKRSNADRFKDICKWLHIGRVNSWDGIEWAKWCGADSIDGTGFFRSQGAITYKNFIQYFEGINKKQLRIIKND